MEPNPNKFAYPFPTKYLVLYFSPIIGELFKALASIAKDPLRPDLTATHINSSVEMLRRKIIRPAKQPRTQSEWNAEVSKLQQQLRELDFALEVIAALRMNMDMVDQELAKNNMK